MWLLKTKFFQYYYIFHPCSVQLEDWQDSYRSMVEEAQHHKGFMIVFREKDKNGKVTTDEKQTEMIRMAEEKNLYKLEMTVGLGWDADKYEEDRELANDFKKRCAQAAKEGKIRSRPYTSVLRANPMSHLTFEIEA